MKIFKIASVCALGLAALTITSCGDVADEIRSLTFGRNFSPLGIESSNVKETTADITWNTSNGANSYTMEVYQDDSLSFEGTPVKVINNLTSDNIPYTLTGLLFDTKYSVRVQAITDGNESRTSKWNGTFFRTGTKQFLKNPKPAEIADRSVTLTWEVEEGFDVSTIVVGTITHQLTAEEKAAGKALIEGLTPETTYTAYLYYNGKQCGNRSFTTIADLAGAILVRSEDDLKKVIEDEELPDGAVIAVYGGTYALNVNDDGQTGAVKINKSVTIKGIYPTDQPKIKGRFEINEGASLSLAQVIVDGTNNSTTDQIFNFKTAEVNYGKLDVQNCIISGREDGKGLVYLNVKATVEAINFNNCIISGIECSGGDFIDSRAGLPREINLTNSTFYTVASTRDFIRVDDASSNFEGQEGPKVTVDHCTLYKVGGANANYRLLYVRFAGNKITFTNNLVVGTDYKRGFTNQSSTDSEPTLNNNFYFECENLTSPGNGADNSIAWFDTDSSAYDIESETGSKIRGKGNGTVLSSSPFLNASPDFTLNPDGDAFKAGVGDPRWRQQ